jgi:hypothetical protein
MWGAQEFWEVALAMKKNARRFGKLIIFLLTSCGPIQSAQVQDHINGMIGLNKEHILSCMGPPTSTANAGVTEVWSYNSLGPINTSAVVSGNQSLAVGSTSTSQEFCVVNLTMQNDRVVAANTRSQGKLLSPNLPCYAVLHACVPNPMPVSAQAERTKEAAAYCKELYQDPRLDPLRGVVALDQPPTLEMQSNPQRITDVQRPALDVFKSLNEQCRNNIAMANPRLWQIMVQVQPAPYERLTQLYDRHITIGEYNAYREEMIEKLRSALAAPPE